MKEKNEKLMNESFKYAVKNINNFEIEKKCGYVILKFNIYKGTIVTASKSTEITEKAKLKLQNMGIFSNFN